MTDDNVTCEVWRGGVYLPISQELLDEANTEATDRLMALGAEAAESDPEAFMMGFLAAANREMGL